MGGSGPSRQRSGIEFPTLGRSAGEGEQEEWEQVEQTSRCCGFEISRKSRRRVCFEDRFVIYCREIAEEFEWAKDLAEMAGNLRLQRGKYLEEMHSLKEGVGQSGVEEALQSEQVDRFKQNLKRSVILSFSHNNNSAREHSHTPKMKSTISRTGVKSRLNFDRYRNSAASSHLEVVLRKSVASFVDDTITEMMGVDKQISKKTAAELEVFLRFTMLLECHLNQTNCFLGRAKRLFVVCVQKMYKNWEKAAKNIGVFVDSVKQFLLLLRESVIDYYRLQTFKNASNYQNAFISNDENVLSACTAILFKDPSFYSTAFRCIVEFNKEREAQFDEILSLLQESPPERFFIKDKFCLNMRTIHSYLSNLREEGETPFDINDVVIENGEPYMSCIQALRELCRTKSPINKMKAIMGCSEGITQQIEKFYNVNGLRKQNWILDADQVLSIFCYIIVKARVQHLHTHLFILDNFATSNQMISMTGYYLSVITCAVEQLKNDYGSDLLMMRANPNLGESSSNNPEGINKQSQINSVESESVSNPGLILNETYPSPSKLVV